MSGRSTINWSLAARVARRVAGRDPLEDSYLYESLHADFAELTVDAEELVAAETGLRSLDGPARARVVDRAAWVDANIASFQRLLRPLTDKLEERLPASSLVAPLTSNIAGAEVGALLGWMSSRVLGQYDLLVIDDEDPDDQDVVYYVGPNVLALEKRFGFPPRQFRLWLALHEVTHRAQFTGVPWMRQHFLSLVDASMGSIDPDPKRLITALSRAAEALTSGRNPLDDGGLMALFASEEQKAVLDQIGGLMSLLEGHGDVTMDRAGDGRIPAAERFGSVLRQRRASAAPLTKLIQQAVGLDAKIKQYAQGEAFLEAIEAAGGSTAIEHVWANVENVPTLAEIRSPELWIERVGATTAA